MTIPMTVIGISAPYFDMAPYFTKVLFITPMITTMESWVRKLLIPSGSIFARYLNRISMLPGSSRKLLA